MFLLSAISSTTLDLEEMEVFILNKAHSEQRIKNKGLYLKTVPSEFLMRSI